jgi:hypothetical protein
MKHSCILHVQVNENREIAGQARNDNVMEGAIVPDLISGCNDKAFIIYNS